MNEQFRTDLAHTYGITLEEQTNSAKANKKDKVNVHFLYCIFLIIAPYLFTNRPTGQMSPKPAVEMYQHPGTKP